MGATRVRVLSMRRVPVLADVEHAARADSLTLTLALTLTLTSALSMRRVPVLADVEREQRGEQGDLLGEMLELALRDVELSDRLGCHGTRYGHGTCRAHAV